jgi:ketosteroid isomerase-like protein
MQRRDIEGLQELCAPGFVLETVASGFTFTSSTLVNCLHYFESMERRFKTLNTVTTNFVVEENQAAVTRVTQRQYMGGLPIQEAPKAQTRLESLAFYRSRGSALERIVSYGDFRSLLRFTEHPRPKTQSSTNSAPKPRRAVSPRLYSNRRWVDLRPSVVALFASINELRPDSIGRLCTPQVVVRDLPLPEPLLGIEAVERFYRYLFTSVPDFHVELRNVIADGTQAAVEWTIAGTPRRPLIPGWSVGLPFELRGASLLWYQGTQLAQVTSYWDWASLEEQMKAPPARQPRVTRKSQKSYLIHD